MVVGAPYDKPPGMMPDSVLPAWEMAKNHPDEYADWLEDKSNVDLLEFLTHMEQKLAGDG